MLRWVAARAIHTRWFSLIITPQTIGNFHHNALLGNRFHTRKTRKIPYVLITESHNRFCSLPIVRLRHLFPIRLEGGGYPDLPAVHQVESKQYIGKQNCHHSTLVSSYSTKCSSVASRCICLLPELMGQRLKTGWPPPAGKGNSQIDCFLIRSNHFSSLMQCKDILKSWYHGKQCYF